jgi:hypothetical protein
MSSHAVDENRVAGIWQHGAKDHPVLLEQSADSVGRALNQRQNRRRCQRGFGARDEYKLLQIVEETTDPFNLDRGACRKLSKFAQTQRACKPHAETGPKNRKRLCSGMQAYGKVRA